MTPAAVPAATDHCACGAPFGTHGRIWLVFEGVERRWRCAACADLEVYAVQLDQFLDSEERDNEQRRRAWAQRGER